MVGQKLDDYAWALKKHGIKTKLGALSCVVAGLAADSLFVETLQAGALGVASSSIWIAERRVELENIQRTNSNAAIAVIYELKQNRRNWLKALMPPWN